MNHTASSTLIAALALLVLLGVALAAGCTTTSTVSKTTATPTAAASTVTSTAATTAAAVTTAGTSGSGSAAGAAVAADRLVPFIPKTAGGWKLDGDAQTVTMKDGEGRDFTMVNGDYVKDGVTETKGTIIIMDSAVAKTPYKEQWASFRSIETNDGWWKSVTVKGQPSWKSYTK